MKQTNENYLSMVSATMKVLNKYESVWSSNVPFSSLVTAIKTDLGDIDLSQQGSGAVTTGVTYDKELAAEQAIKLALKLSKLGQAYALMNDDNALHDQLHTTNRKLNRYHDQELAPALRAMFEKLSGLGDDAVAFGITKEELIKLNDLITKYDNMKSSPRLMISERKGHTTNIPLIIRHLRDLLGKTDRLIYLWSETNPEFLSTYKNARIILDLGVRHEKKEEK